jgi:hypothetical protein
MTLVALGPGERAQQIFHIKISGRPNSPLQLTTDDDGGANVA